MTTLKIDELKDNTEVTTQEAMDVKGGGGWGMAQYQYGFEGSCR